MKIKIFHNPKCSKSRETLKLLNERGLEPEIVLYLKNPPTENELGDIVKKMGMAPKELIRFKEKTASELGLSFSEIRPDAEWLKLMVDHPVLIERPIVLAGDQAALGRPPEKVLKIIDL